MKPLLLVLLAASLAANVVLMLRTRPPAGSSAHAVAQATIPTDAAVRSSARAAATGAPREETATGRDPAPPAAPVWKPVGSDADLQRLVSDLRSAGFPAPVIRAVVNQLLNERFASRQPGAGQPFWRQGVRTSETLAAQNALQRERQALLESLLGADARPSATLDPTTRQHRYGNLSDEKVDAIARIETDYSEVNAEMWARRQGSRLVDGQGIRQSQQVMEEEKLADLAAVLTPDELAQYEMRNSRTARMVMNGLRNIDITEQEYAQLYAAQKALDTANPPDTSSAAGFAQRQADQLVVHEKLRAVLGDARFYSYIEGADIIYAHAVRAFAAFPGVTPEKTYAVYRLQVELQGAMSRLGGDSPSTPEKSAQMNQARTTYNAQLEQLVGAEAASAYRRTITGRIFGGRTPDRATPATGR